MANEVKWIKLFTNMFDNRKIKQIEKMKDGDSILVIWLKLLILAGNINDNGFVYFTKDIPYTNEMLATEFNRPIETIKSALHTFEDYKMIEIVDDIMRISNWEKYQNIDGLERIREQTRIRVQRHRAKLKDSSNDTCNEDETLRNAIDIEEDKEEDKDIKKKEVKHKYGEYDNVLLTDTELEKLKDEFPDWQNRIDKLSAYMKSTGKHYKDHLATIRNWARMEKERNQKNTNGNMRNGFERLLREEVEKENVIDVDIKGVI